MTAFSFSRTVRFNFEILNVCMMQYSTSIKLFSFVICFINKKCGSGHRKLRVCVVTSPNGLVHMLLVIRLEHKFGCFSFIVASKD